MPASWLQVVYGSAARLSDSLTLRSPTEPSSAAMPSSPSPTIGISTLSTRTMSGMFPSTGSGRKRRNFQPDAHAQSARRNARVAARQAHRSRFRFTHLNRTLTIPPTAINRAQPTGDRPPSLNNAWRRDIRIPIALFTRTERRLAHFRGHDGRHLPDQVDSL